MTTDDSVRGNDDVQKFQEYRIKIQSDITSFFEEYYAESTWLLYQQTEFSDIRVHYYHRIDSIREMIYFLRDDTLDVPHYAKYTSCDT